MLATGLHEINAETAMRRWLAGRSSFDRVVLICSIALAVCALCAPAWASSIILKDGRRLRGGVGKVSGLADSPLKNQANDPRTITFIDDDLRRVFVPTFRIQSFEEADSGDVQEKIGIRQRVARPENAGRVSRVGQLSKVGQFDEFGRRAVTMMTGKGELDVIQGITQITPRWTRVEGLLAGKQPVVWDMRIATSSIDRETLHRILMKQVDPKKLEQRLRIVRLLLQSERYFDAEQELKAVIADFPEQKDLAKEVAALHQLYARSIVKEIEMRRKAGQHQWAYALLEQFPPQDVAAETLQQVREMLEEYRATQKASAEMFASLTKQVAEIKDTQMRLQCEALVKEMQQELSFGTLGRLAAYREFNDDKNQSVEDKLSLAFSGWLLGQNSADRNLQVTLSLAQLRKLAVEYLNEPIKLEREKIYQRMRGLEGASPPQLALLLSHMKPPLPTPEPSVSEPGMYKLTIPIGIEKEPDATYYVQLPPQYDPYMHYPTVLTLCGPNTSPQQQIDWWAGERNQQGMRIGQATRQGYIVIAVDWVKEGQRDYEYSAREHAAVLGSLRDACRRFSIDTDRVFLSGHSMGGDAAWDIGLAHPDLWAGVIPIAAQCEKYSTRYWENAHLVPFYLLGGELDGDKTKDNAPHLNRYMNARYDVNVVEYRGRGHEDFHEDILNLFEWMGRREPRNFFPKEFTVSTMRSWDNFFWWLEVGQLPSKGVVEPSDWPPRRGVIPIKITGKILATNGVSISSAVKGVTVWLSPEMVNFDRPMKIALGDKSIAKSSRIQPDLEVMLEDVRTRADRQHPFWAKVQQE